MPEYQKADHIAKAIAASQSAEAHDVGLGSRPAWNWIGGDPRS